MIESVCVDLFSVEQKKVTQGLSTLWSEEGGRYMASEKHVSSRRSSSVLGGGGHAGFGKQQHGRYWSGSKNLIEAVW